MLAALLAGALGSGATAASYELAVDAAGSAWVLDGDSGALRRCRSVAGGRPKVLDVFGGVGEARPERQYPRRPGCELALSSEAWGDGVPGLASGGRAYGYAGLGALSAAVWPGMLGDGSSGVQVGVGAGMLGDGGYGGYDAPDTQVIIVRPERIDLAFY
jgi:NADPH:quinone reductase-like Zn-dependent oxidoreductase